MDFATLIKSYIILTAFFPLTLSARILIEIEIILLLIMRFNNVLFNIS